MSLNYNYDWIFFSSEDENIKEKVKNEFKDKIKFLNQKIKIIYNYNEKKYFGKMKDVFGNMDFAKTYLMNIYILSNCIDIIMSRTSGATGVIIMANGFRNSIIYNLGEYSL